MCLIRHFWNFLVCTQFLSKGEPISMKEALILQTPGKSFLFVLEKSLPLYCSLILIIFLLLLPPHFDFCISLSILICCFLFCKYLSALLPSLLVNISPCLNIEKTEKRHLAQGFIFRGGALANENLESADNLFEKPRWKKVSF